jgi:hypothetical protein
MFAGMQLPALPAGRSWRLNPGDITVFLNVVASVPGDYNNNGIVDAGDYVVWRKTLGQTGAALAADGNANNQIDPGDYDVWRAHFGQSAGSGSGASSHAAVPEPATAGLLIFAAAVRYLRRCPAARKLRTTHSCANIGLLHCCVPAHPCWDTACESPLHCTWLHSQLL